MKDPPFLLPSHTPPPPSINPLCISPLQLRTCCFIAVQQQLILFTDPQNLWSRCIIRIGPKTYFRLLYMVTGRLIIVDRLSEYRVVAWSTHPISHYYRRKCDHETVKKRTLSTMLLLPIAHFHITFHCFMNVTHILGGQVTSLFIV